MPVTLKIKEPWWGAFKRFGWPKGTWGVGLNKRDVDAAAKSDDLVDLHIWKFKTVYRTSAKAIQEYAKGHNTLYTARAGTQLYVIPSTMIGVTDDEQTASA